MPFTIAHRVGNASAIQNNALQWIVGVLGPSLPIGLYIGNYYQTHNWRVLGSISEYFYTCMTMWFVGIMWTIGITFCIYKGFDKWDDRITRVSGICAIVLASSPMPLKSTMPEYCLWRNIPTWALPRPESGYEWSLHYISASVFLISLAWMAWFQFTQTTPATNGQPVRPNVFAHAGATFSKIRANIFYRVSAISIANSLIVAAIMGYTTRNHGGSNAKHPWLFVCETVSVSFFAAAWLVKARFS